MVLQITQIVIGSYQSVLQTKFSVQASHFLQGKTPNKNSIPYFFPFVCQRCDSGFASLESCFESSPSCCRLFRSRFKALRTTLHLHIFFFRLTLHTCSDGHSYTPSTKDFTNCSTHVSDTSSTSIRASKPLEAFSFHFLLQTLLRPRSS